MRALLAGKLEQALNRAHVRGILREVARAHGLDEHRLVPHSLRSIALRLP